MRVELAPSVVWATRTPRAGTPITLTADSAGRGVAYAWDFDDDGPYDGAGANTTPRSTAGDHRVPSAPPTRTAGPASASSTLQVHATSSRPGPVYVFPRSAARGQPVAVDVDAFDSDGRSSALRSTSTVTGRTRTATIIPAGRGRCTARRRSRSRPPASARCARASSTTAATSARRRRRSTCTPELPPIAALAPRSSSPRPGVEMTLRAPAATPTARSSATSSTSTVTAAYEKDNGTQAAVKTSFATAGTRVVGVRVTDDSGGDGDAAGARSRSRRATQPPTRRAWAHQLRLPHLLRVRRPTPTAWSSQYAWDLDGDEVYDDCRRRYELLRDDPGSADGHVRDRASCHRRRGGDRTERIVVTLTISRRSAASSSRDPVRSRARADCQLCAEPHGQRPPHGRVGPRRRRHVGRPRRHHHFTSPMCSTAGPRTVKVRVTDRQGRSAVGQTVVTVSPADGNLAAGRADFFTSPPYPRAACRRISYSSRSATARAGRSLAIAWDLDGDGGLQRRHDASAGSHTFAAAGRYTFGVRVTDNLGGEAVQRRVDRGAMTGTVHRAAYVSGLAEARHGRGRPRSFALLAVVDENASMAWAWDTDDDGDVRRRHQPARQGDLRRPGPPAASACG